MFERPASDRPPLAQAFEAMRFYHFANGLGSFLFACTGPVALVLGIGLEAGLTGPELSSYIFAGFFIGGLITITLSTLYRTPLIHAWTIPGSAIAGAALLDGTPYSDIVGAYLVTGGLMAVLGLTGGFGWLMRRTPVPIVMAMVAGVFLKFGLWVVSAFEQSTAMALAATGAFVAVTLIPSLARNFPPILAALIAAAVVVTLSGEIAPGTRIEDLVVTPVFFSPTFSAPALLDLVLPLLISVLALQNAQGIVILRAAGHNPPVNTVTFACGAGSVVFGLLGCVNTCLTGPANALVMANGEPRHHWMGAVWFGILGLFYGLFSPVVTGLALAAPKALLFVIGGLAMLRVLQQSLTQAFGQRFALGATVTFIVTITDLIPGVRADVFGVGAPVWGLVFGIGVSLLLEREDFEAQRASKA